MKRKAGLSFPSKVHLFSRFPLNSIDYALLRDYMMSRDRELATATVLLVVNSGLVSLSVYLYNLALALAWPGRSMQFMISLKYLSFHSFRLFNMTSKQKTKQTIQLYGNGLLLLPEFSHSHFPDIHSNFQFNLIRCCCC